MKLSTCGNILSETLKLMPADGLFCNDRFYDIDLLDTASIPGTAVPAWNDDGWYFTLPTGWYWEEDAYYHESGDAWVTEADGAWVACVQNQKGEFVDAPRAFGFAVKELESE